jgi:hypothetical protein
MAYERLPIFLRGAWWQTCASVFGRIFLAAVAPDRVRTGCQRSPLAAMPRPKFDRILGTANGRRAQMMPRPDRTRTAGGALRGWTGGKRRPRRMHRLGDAAG